MRFRLALPPSTLAFGAARLGAFWQGNSVLGSLRTLSAALDAGVNFIDTADVYARGLSERIIGFALRKRRDEALVCTKVGQLKTPLAMLMAQRSQAGSLAALRRALTRTPADTSLVPRCFDSAYVEWALRTCLKRLRSDRVDVLLLHGPSQTELAEERFAAAAQRLLAAGDIAHFGVSCDTPELALRAADLPYVSFVEVPMDCTMTGRAELATQLAGRGVGVLARSPFGGGTLASALAELGPDGYAYCLQSITSLPDVLTTIVGMSRPERVRDNLALANRVLAPSARERVERALGPQGSKPANPSNPVP